MLITLLITYCKRVESIDIIPWRHTTSANRSTLLGKANYTYPKAIYIPKSKSLDYCMPYYICFPFDLVIILITLVLIFQALYLLKIIAIIANVNYI